MILCKVEIAADLMNQRAFSHNEHSVSLIKGEDMIFTRISLEACQSTQNSELPLTFFVDKTGSEAGELITWMDSFVRPS